MFADYIVPIQKPDIYCIWLVMRRPWNRSLTVALTILDRSMDSDFFMGRWASTIEEMLPSPLLDFDEMNALLSPYSYTIHIHLDMTRLSISVTKSSNRIYSDQ